MVYVRIVINKRSLFISGLLLFILLCFLSYTLHEVKNMKVLIINKKQIIFSFTLIILILSTFLLFKFLPKEEIQVISPIDTKKTTSIDLTGDNIEDTIEIVNIDGNTDVKITIGNKNYYLSKLCDNNILGDSKSFWPIKVFVQKISRNSCPEIIIQSSRKKSMTYIFKWSNGEFVKLFSSDKNIFGLLDSSSAKTPQFYSLSSSSGISSLESFMIIDNELLDITKDCSPIPDLANILSLINLLQKEYELDEIPDIFSENIPENELGLLWNLDKEHNLYSFQDGFFYDESLDNEGNITSMKWRLTFEKYIKNQDDSSKEEVIFYITSTRDSQRSYKISSIYKK